MDFEPGDIWDYIDMQSSLMVRISKYEIFNLDEKDYERFILEVLKVHEDKDNKYEKGHMFTRERPVGALEEEVGWSLTRITE